MKNIMSQLSLGQNWAVLRGMVISLVKIFVVFIITMSFIAYIINLPFSYSYFTHSTQSATLVREIIPKPPVIPGVLTNEVITGGETTAFMAPVESSEPTQEVTGESTTTSLPDTTLDAIPDATPDATQNTVPETVQESGTSSGELSIEGSEIIPTDTIVNESLSSTEEIKVIDSTTQDPGTTPISE